MNRSHSLKITTIVAQIGTHVMQPLKERAPQRTALFALLVILVSIAGLTARLTWHAETARTAATIPAQAAGYAHPNVDPAFYAEAAEPFIPAQAQGYAHPVVDPAFYPDAASAPTIPWQALPYARPNVDPAFYHTDAEPFIPPQAQGYAHPVVDPAFYQDATADVTIPWQALPYAQPVVDPAFYQDAPPAAGNTVVVIGLASSVAVVILGSGLVLAHIRQRRKRATASLAGI